MKTQIFVEQCAAVDIMKSKSTGQRFARISYFARMSRKPRALVPLDIIELAAGSDAWMRDIQFRCADVDCRSIHKASEMQNGYCPSCIEKAEQENAIADGKPNLDRIFEACANRLVDNYTKESNT